MKKVLLVLLLFGLFFCACQSQEKQKTSLPKTDHKTAEQLSNKKRQADSIYKNHQVDYLNEIP